MRRGGKGWAVHTGPEGGGGSVVFDVPEKTGSVFGWMADAPSLVIG